MARLSVSERNDTFHSLCPSRNKIKRVFHESALKVVTGMSPLPERGGFRGEEKVWLKKLDPKISHGEPPNPRGGRRSVVALKHQWKGKRKHQLFGWVKLSRRKGVKFHPGRSAGSACAGKRTGRLFANQGMYPPGGHRVGKVKRRMGSHEGRPWRGKRRGGVLLITREGVRRAQPNRQISTPTAR